MSNSWCVCFWDTLMCLIVLSWCSYPVWFTVNKQTEAQVVIQGRLAVTWQSGFWKEKRFFSYRNVSFNHFTRREDGGSFCFKLFIYLFLLRCRTALNQGRNPQNDEIGCQRKWTLVWVYMYRSCNNTLFLPLLPARLHMSYLTPKWTAVNFKVWLWKGGSEKR